MQATSEAPRARPHPVLVALGFVVVTVVFGYGSVWPFMNGWSLRQTPSFEAAHTWMLKSDTMGALVGGHRYLESDWFPKGGDDGTHARFQFKISGDLDKLDVAVLLEKEGDDWVVTRAGKKLEDDSWVDIYPAPAATTPTPAGASEGAAEAPGGAAEATGGAAEATGGGAEATGGGAEATGAAPSN